MGVTEHPMQALAAFLPENSFEPVVQYIHQYKVHLTVTRKRKSVLGDFRHAAQNSNHRISINGNLNIYEFLITLLHELAHLLTFEQFGNRVDAHGKEWKLHYSRLLFDFVHRGIFPPDIEMALQKSINNPAATANGETELLLVLRKYDTRKKEDHFTVAELPEGAVFALEDGRVFKKGVKRRKRFECIELETGHKYSFSPLSEVRMIVNGE
ncbi:MAG: SprT-like domain-containing protein [Bacteroidota bacterium]|nr:SprT-like domain-containing protein [Bacteroidota bacterium]